MLFDPEALENKRRHLDEVLRVPGLLDRVLARHLGADFTALHIPRVWEPGGGSTLFRVVAGDERLLLKVKHRTVWVESRLESEPDFLRVPSLENEHRFLAGRDEPWLPRVRFFDREDDHLFLAFEELQPFEAGVAELGGAELVQAWDDVVAAVRALFEQGIVHTDVHEHNLCFRGRQPVLIDFEEARPLRQDVPFGASLDVAGHNRYGDVGAMPDTPSGIAGRTCLARLRTVFERLVEQRLPALLAQCSFDQDCPFNLDVLQQKDERLYQSVAVGSIRIPGQRPVDDPRLGLLAFLLRRFAKDGGPVRYLDIGCNLGAFCFRAAGSSSVAFATGIDASAHYVGAARCLAFLAGIGNARFETLYCGSEPLDRAGPADVVSMFSMYHHIREKDRFLDDLRGLAPRFVIAEFATQDRFYPERGHLTAEIEHVRRRAGFEHAQVVAVSPDYDRPVIVFSHAPLDRVTLFGARVVNRRRDLARAVVRKLAGPSRRWVRRALGAASMRLGSRAAAPAAVRALAFVAGLERPEGGIRVHPRHPSGYQEVTGYLVPTLRSYGERERAVRCIEWLIAVQRPDGSFVDPDHGLSYVFDTGQALRGLLAGLDLVPAAREAARRAAEYLCASALDGGNGGFPAAYEDTPYVPESIQLYVLPPLVDAAAKLGEPRYADCAARCLAHYVARPGLLDVDRSLTHFLAYEIEALIDLGREDLARPALDRLAELAGPDGGVRALGGERWVCSPGLLQLALCWYKTGHVAVADRAMAYMERRQNASGGWYGGYGPGTWYFPQEEPAWVPKYYLDAHRWRVRRHFDQAVDDFPATIDPSDGRFQAILGATRDGDRVLDAGCGKGRFLRALREARAGLDCTGVDLSPAILACVPDGIATREGPIEDLPAPDDAFDVVFSVEAIEHLANPRGAVRELVRVARPGGRIVVIDKERSHWGRFATPAWEQWLDREAVSGWLAESCDDVTVTDVSYDGHAADGLMLAWCGTKRGAGGSPSR